MVSFATCAQTHTSLGTWTVIKLSIDIVTNLVAALPVPALLLAEERVLAVNEEARELLGYRDSREQPRSLEEFLIASELIAKLSSSSAGEATIASADNEFLHASMSKRSVDVGGTSARVVVFTSIATRASRDARRDRRALDVCRVGVYEHDYVQDDFYGSALLREMYGFSADEELTLQVFGSAFHPGDRDRVISEILKSQDPKGDGIFDSLIRIIRPDGEVRWIQSRALTEFGEVDGERQPLFCTGSVTDVTERIQLALALERSEERYATARRWRRLDGWRVASLMTSTTC